MAIQQCFDHATLERFLGEQLSAAEEAAVTEHIETCEICRDSLAAIAGNEAVWNDIHENLEDLQFEKTEDHIYEDFPQDNRKDLERVKSLLAPTDDPKMLGRLGQYEVVGIIGRGSAGIVVKALDVRLNRYVAIKILAPVYSENGSARRRFEREGRSIASIRDNHVIPVYIVDEFQGHPYIVMQYVPGGSLQQRIDKGGPLDTREAALVGMQIARGLAAAHRRGVVHRDVKPANVLLDSGVERAMVTDFGLARVVDEATMTHSSAISGTPQYMSPEQAQGTHVDQRSDLFSLGSLLYAACTGHSPFRSETVFGVIKRVCESQPRPIREVNPSIELWLETLISKLHSKNREDRFSSATEVADILAKELAHLQSPTLVPEPNRDWMPRAREMVGMDRRRAAIAGTLTVACVGVVLAVWQPWDASNDQLGEARTVRSSSPLMESADADLRGDIIGFGGSRSNGSSGKANKSLGMGYWFDQIEDNLIPLRVNANHAIEVARDKAKEHDWEGAIEIYDSVLAKDEKNPEALYDKGLALAGKSDTKQAVVFITRAIDNGFRDYQVILQDPQLKSLRLEPKFLSLVKTLEAREKARELANKAKNLALSEKFEKAIAKAKESLELDDANEKAKFFLAYTYHVTDKLDEAKPLYEALLKSDEFKAVTEYNLACIHAANNELDEAVNMLQTAIDDGFHDVYLLRNDEDLTNLRSASEYKAIFAEIEETLASEVGVIKSSEEECNSNSCGVTVTLSSSCCEENACDVENEIETSVEEPYWD